MANTDNRGVTLIELLVAIIISAFLVTGIYSLFIVQTRTYSVQDSVADIQQDARAVLAMMVKDIRMAGFLTGGGTASGFTVGGGATPISLRGTDRSYALEFTNSSVASDEITVVCARDFVGEVTAVPVANQVTVDQTVSLIANDYVAFDLHNSTLYQVQSATGNTITLTSSPSPAIVVGERVYQVDSVTYSVDAVDGELDRNGQPVAGGGGATIVEDLQFAYQVDGDTTWHNTIPGGSSNADIRMVRVNLIVRTAVPDPEDTGFSKPACEDRAEETTNTGCRRRLYTTTVKVRNLDL